MKQILVCIAGLLLFCALIAVANNSIWASKISCIGFIIAISSILLKRQPRN
jgi:hypothetical protein